LPREVFFFGLGFAGVSLPAAAARAFCFFVAMRVSTLLAAVGKRRIQLNWLG